MLLSFIAQQLTPYKNTSNCLIVLLLQTSMINKLDRIHRNFLWEGQGEKGRMHLMKWNKVVKPQGAGGLGLVSNKEAATRDYYVWAGNSLSCRVGFRRVLH